MVRLFFVVLGTGLLVTGALERLEIVHWGTFEVEPVTLAELISRYSPNAGEPFKPRPYSSRVRLDGVEVDFSRKKKVGAASLEAPIKNTDDQVRVENLSDAHPPPDGPTTIIGLVRTRRTPPIGDATGGKPEIGIEDMTRDHHQRHADAALAFVVGGGIAWALALLVQGLVSAEKFMIATRTALALRECPPHTGPCGICSKVDPVVPIVVSYKTTRPGRAGYSLITTASQNLDCCERCFSRLVLGLWKTGLLLVLLFLLLAPLALPAVLLLLLPCTVLSFAFTCATGYRRGGGLPNYVYAIGFLSAFSLLLIPLAPVLAQIPLFLAGPFFLYFWWVQYSFGRLLGPVYRSLQERLGVTWFWNPVGDWITFHVR